MEALSLQKIRWPSGRSPAQPAEAEQHLAELYRLKTFLLFPEVALFTAVLVAVPWQASLAQMVNLLLLAALCCALASALAGAVLVVVGAFRRLRSNEAEVDSPPGRANWSLVLAALAVGAGIFTGSALGQRNINGLAGVLWNIGLTGMLVAGVLAMPFRFGRSRVHHRPLPLIGWMFVFAGISYAGSWIGFSGREFPWTLPLVFAILCLAPVASLLTGAMSSRWLLHPYTLRDLWKENLSLQLRLALAFLVASAWAPGGGLVVPLWAAARRRLQVSAVPIPMAPQPRPAPSGVSLVSLSSEKRRYTINHIIAHQVEEGTAKTLFQQIEKHPFFAEQATCSGGFGRGSEDIERHILPLVLKVGDWERFLRYSSLAINLRRIADDLAEPDLLPVLARHGHRQLALDAAARVSDPVQRALGQAILAASLDPDDADRRRLFDLVRDELASLAPVYDPEEAQARAEALFQIGRHLGPEILPALQRIPPPREGQDPTPGLLAMSAAVGALQRNGGLDAEAWHILRNLREQEVLAYFLPDLLGDVAATVEPERLLDNLSTLSLEPETLWACRLGILAGQTRTSPEAAVHSWKTLPTDPPFPGSVALIERGAALFAALIDPEIDTEEQTIENPMAQAALRAVVLEHRPNGATDSAAREAIARLPPGPERLHWTLRRATVSPMPDAIRRNETRAIGRQLFEQQHRAPFDDLRRYLELVARCLPKELQRRAEDVLLSLGGGAPLLFHLAATCASRAVLENLFEEAESYLSSLVGLPELEGARLWRELMYQVTGRLCLLREDLTALDQAAETLRETDPLAARVTGSLAGAGAMELAAEVSSRIQSGRLRLATRLRWLPEMVISSRDLEPEPLYNALASVNALEDEWLGLAALHDPDPPEILFQRYLDRIGDRDTQVVALFRLTQRVLANPETTREKGLLALQMLGQALGAMQSDTHLVALTPWLPELMARVDPDLALEEYREAFARLFGLHTVPWPVRRDALERLLVGLASALFAREGKASHRARSAGALFTGFEQLLAEGITGQEESVAADFLPVLTAALERLPAEVAVNLKQSLGSRLRFSDAGSEQIRALCQASITERIRTFETWRNVEPSFRYAQALVYLLVRERSDQALALLDQVPTGSQRDDLCRRLVAHSWVTGRAAGETIQRIGDSGMAREISIRIGCTSSDTEEWITPFASLAAESGVDPSDPTWMPLIQDLWNSEPEPRRQILAESVLTALGKGAPQTAESALRLWLHAHLSPAG